MNKIIKKIGIAVLTASMLISTVAFAACDKNGNENTENNEHKHSLTKVAAVAAGCETDGSTEYYTCGCGKWFKDESANTEIADHTSVVIKATGHKWDGGVISDDNTTKIFTCGNCKQTRNEEVSSSSEIFTITYNFNYENAPEAEVKKYEGGKVATAPQEPVHSDTSYVFGGWYLQSKCVDEYTFTEPLIDNIELYAKWNEKKQDVQEMQETLYVFEAEYTKVKTLKGVGWSNEAKGLDMIMRDTDGKVGTPGVSGASNGFYVGYLYKGGITLTFVINSDRDIDNATLKLRASGEMVESINLSSEEYLIKVNDEKIDYAGISITGIDPSPDAVKHAFQDFVITTSLKLKAGENKITLTTNNGIKLGGTATATAPLIDCIKITAAAELTWSPVEKNLADWAEE